MHVLRYADDGPPSTVKPLAGSHGAQVYEGWAVLQGREPDGGVRAGWFYGTDWWSEGRFFQSEITDYHLLIGANR